MPDRGQAIHEPVSAILLVVAILTVAVGLSTSHSLATLSGDVEVVETSCDEYGHVDEITIRVEYRGDDPVTVTPHVWSSKHHIQYAWEPANVTLQPGDVTRITLEAPERDAAPDPGERAQLYLAAGANQRLTTSWTTGRCETRL